MSTDPGKAAFLFGILNPNWFSIKAQYFFQFAGVFSYFTFIVPFYVSLGLSTTQIGAIEFLNILLSVFSWPIVGSIADKSKRHSLILAIVSVGFLIPNASLALFSPITRTNHPVSLKTLNKSSFEVEACSSQTAQHLLNTTSIFISSESKQIDRNLTESFIFCKNLGATSSTSAFLTLKPESHPQNCSHFLLKFDDNQFEKLFNDSESIKNCTFEFPFEAPDTRMTFLIICILRSVSAVFLEPALTLTDAIAYDMLGSENRGLWGQQRMFAPIGSGLAAGLVGTAADYFQSFRICFLTYAFLIALTVAIALFWLPKRLVNLEEKTKRSEIEIPFCEALKPVFLSPIFCINCVIAILSGMLLSVTQVVWPRYMDELGAPKKFFGLTVALISLFEIPGLFFAGSLVKLVGIPTCFFFMFIAYALRFGADAFLTPETVWLALPIESLHIFCWVFYFAAASQVAAIIAPPGTSSTVQSLLGASYAGIGVGSGVLLTSLIYQTFGSYIAFLIYSAFAVLNFFILTIFYFAYLRKAMAEIMKEKANSVKQEETNEALICNNNGDL